jgi:hypothetical protein
MLAYGVISFISLRKEKKIDTKEIDKEIIRKNYLSLFIKGFFLNIINIEFLAFGWQSLFL